MHRTEMGRVAVGGVYLFARTGWRYRVLCFALQTHARQWQVVYEGLDGDERGLHYCCPVADFATKFEPAPAEPSGPAPAVADIEERPAPAPEVPGKGY